MGHPTVGSNLRYRLSFQLHHVVQDDHVDAVVTVHRWDCVNSARPRAIHLVAENGVEKERTVYTKPADLTRLTENLQALTGRVTAISDDDARAEILRRTGYAPPTQCLREWCGAVHPVGSDRCVDWHSSGQVSSGAMSGTRWVGFIVPGNRGTTT